MQTNSPDCSQRVNAFRICQPLHKLFWIVVELKQTSAMCDKQLSSPLILAERQAIIAAICSVVCTQFVTHLFVWRWQTLTNRIELLKQKAKSPLTSHARCLTNARRKRNGGVNRNKASAGIGLRRIKLMICCGKIELFESDFCGFSFGFSSTVSCFSSFSASFLLSLPVHSRKCAHERSLKDSTKLDGNLNCVFACRTVNATMRSSTSTSALM